MQLCRLFQDSQDGRHLRLVLCDLTALLLSIAVLQEIHEGKEEEEAQEEESG